MADQHTASEAKWKEDRKRLVLEAKRLQKELQTAQTRCQQYKQKIQHHQSHELALMQTNRLLVDIIKSYADREATLMANWKTLQQAFGPAPEHEVVDLDRD